MRLTRLLTVLALVGFSLACAGMGEEAPTPEPISEAPDEYNALEEQADRSFEMFSASIFDYCDAVVLAGHWKNDSTWEAKLFIGEKLGNGNKGFVLSELESGRMAAASNMDNHKLRCDFSIIGYSYDDMTVLAEFWGVDTWDARIRVEEKYLRDGHVKTHIDEQLRMARENATFDEGEHFDDSNDPFTRYANSDYDYCDAKVLAGYWGGDTYEMKTTIGNKLIWGQQSYLDRELSAARTNAVNTMANRELRCHYNDIGFRYEDAVALAELWGIDSWEAKMRIEEKYLRDGHDDTHIKEALRMARSGH